MDTDTDTDRLLRTVTREDQEGVLHVPPPLLLLREVHSAQVRLRGHEVLHAVVPEAARHRQDAQHAAPGDKAPGCLDARLLARVLGRVVVREPLRAVAASLIRPESTRSRRIRQAGRQAGRQQGDIE
jgi:hypothetical protein